jgi:LmbE family N-acetylglucosaminyl deacetylase
MASLSEQHCVPCEVPPIVPRGGLVVFAPHPDHEVLGRGSTIMRHVAAGGPVTVVIATVGSFDHPEGRWRRRLCASPSNRRAAEAQFLG